MGKEFIGEVAPIVQKLAPQYDILCCSAVISQAIIESGWGDSKLSKQYHNYFGIKCGTAWKGPSVNMATQEEYEPGVITNITDNFRVYSSMEEGVKGYFELLGLSRYQNLKGVTDYKRYAELIKQDGYATSSEYVNLIVQVVEENNLTQYDPKGQDSASSSGGTSEGAKVPSIDTLVKRMRYWCDEANLGYDQYNRWDIRVGGECDCSSLVIFACREAGFDTGDASYTGNMRSNFTARGWKVVPNNGNPQYGDILLNDSHHVAVYVGSGLLSQASIDENGKIAGGMAGDQTDRETYTRSYYNYPWSCYLRWGGGSSSGGSTTVNPDLSGSVDDLARRVINGEFGDGNTRKQILGDKYDAVQKRVNEILNGSNSTDNQSIDELARRVLNGEFGNGDERKRRLGDKYDAVQRKVNELLGNTSPSSPAQTLPEPESSITAGTYRVVVDSLNVRTGPSTNYSSVATYRKGNTVVLDGWSNVAGGYLWGRYIGSSSGQYRYIAVKVISSGQDYAVRC